MNQPFRVAIVGCGKIAPRHIRACLVSPRTRLVALVDPVVSRARQLARRFAVDAFVGSTVSDVVRRVDGVVVAVPNHVHREVAVECLTARLPVLIEKPLATTVQDGRAICSAAADHGVVAAVGYMTRFRANVRLMGELLARREFGAVHRFAYQAGSRGSWSPVSAYNLDRTAAGGGVLVVTGTHFLDRMLSWFGYPEDARLLDDALEGPEANAVATFRFSAEAVDGTARFSKTVSLPGGFVMRTEAGTVVLRESPDAEIVLRPDDPVGTEVAYRSRTSWSSDGFVQQLEDFVDAARGERPPMVSAAQGLDSLRLIETLYAHRTPMDSAWYPTSERSEVTS